MSKCLWEERTNTAQYTGGQKRVLQRGRGQKILAFIDDKGLLPLRKIVLAKEVEWGQLRKEEWVKN